MAYRWIGQPRGIITIWLLLIMAVIVACGGAAEVPAAPEAIAAPEKKAEAPKQIAAPAEKAATPKPMTAPEGAPTAIAPISKPAAAAPTAATAQSEGVPTAVPEASGPSALDSANFGVVNSPS